MSVYSGFAALEADGWSDSGIVHGYVTQFARATDMAAPALAGVASSGQTVLDLCCGQGNVSASAMRKGCDVTGVDFSDQMLALARKRVPGVTFLQGDAQDLPFADASFDTVLCGFGLMHVPDQPKALSEIRRVLRPGGTCAMTSWQGPDRSPVFGMIYSSVREHGAPDIMLPDSPDFHQYAAEDTARALFDAAGLELQRFVTLACHLDLDDPVQLADIMQEGTPRAGYLLSRQPAGNLAAIRQAISDHLRADFRNSEHGWRVPMPAALAVARV